MGEEVEQFRMFVAPSGGINLTPKLRFVGSDDTDLDVVVAFLYWRFDGLIETVLSSTGRYPRDQSKSRVATPASGLTSWTAAVRW